MQIHIKKILLLSIISLLSCNLYSNIIPSGGLDGKNWKPGSTQFISWNKFFMDTTQNLNIYLWNGETQTLTQLGSNIPAAQSSYTCTLPLSLPAGKLYKVKITYADTNATYAIFSKDFFPIGNYEVTPSTAEIIYTIDKTKEVDISPNPATSKVKITSKNSSSFFAVEIYNEAGMKLLSSTFDYTVNKDIDISSLSTGSYNILIKFLGETISEKLVITK